ncbi:8-oxoguanine DNA glycosylase [Sphingomonas hankookensis]|uniref:8-oxoguanine DNA glycosylase n=1 Tax=Sphingomonas hankookensis TaxID=563996 RepID=UPI003F7B337D
MHFRHSASTQSIVALIDGARVERRFPNPDHRIPGHGIAWGGVEEIGSPAYWSAQSWLWEIDEPDHYRLGRSLREEVLACLLGGHGISAEVGLAAYQRLRARPDKELLDFDRCCELLLEPLDVGGRAVRYRFANQKARYVAGAMAGLDGIPDMLGDIELRDALAGLPGIGLKTASWVVRNWRGSDAVSILDVHIIRAAEGLGLFGEDWRVSKDYRLMERAYLAFCRAIGARASILDSVMWMTMRQLPPSIAITMTPDLRTRLNRNGGVGSTGRNSG